MRLLVFSDSHHDIKTCSAIINKLPPCDMIIHAGDLATDAQKLQDIFPDTEIKYVVGNCDSLVTPDELLIEADGKRIFLTHGHRYCVKFDYDYHTIYEKAKSEKADIVIFGHTHVPFNNLNNGILLFNPGSIKSILTFGIIEIENGKISADICNADLWL